MFVSGWSDCLSLIKADHHCPIQIHGSLPYHELRQLGIVPSSIIDFSAAVNPYPLPEGIQRLFTCDGIMAYPDTECHEARMALAAHHEISNEWILVTAGLTETLFILPSLYKRAIQFSPTYGDYSAAYSRLRRRIENIRFPRSESEFGETIDSLKLKMFRLLIICNPNNPNGRYLPLYRIKELCEIFEYATICIDESYQEISENCDSAIPLIPHFRNLLILKSLTKPFGIGGLRAGYAVSSGGVLKRIRQCLMPWGVSSLAQKVIPALLRNYSQFAQQWDLVMSEKRRMMEQLHGIGIEVINGRCPFFLARLQQSSTVRNYLLEFHHIAVRDCTSFGLFDMLRIMPSLPQNNTIL